MTYARAHLIDPINTGYYHLTSRCVRRAWLCGVDKQTGRNFNHRKDWIEQRILYLSKIFAVEIYSYAIMSNHYHVVARVEPREPLQWTDEMVAERWLLLCPVKSRTAATTRQFDLRLEALMNDKERLAICRERLGSLSWFMRFINEPLARLANREDQCTGRFWEGRFSSQVLLDEAALLTCMAYVDLNPVRARMTENILTSPNTSISHRINQLSGPHHDPRLLPINGLLGSHPPALDVTLSGYRSILEWTVQVKENSPDKPPPDVVYDNLGILGQSLNDWLWRYHLQSNRSCRAFGSSDVMAAFIRKIGQRWIKFYQQQTPAPSTG